MIVLHKKGEKRISKTVPKTETFFAGDINSDMVKHESRVENLKARVDNLKARVKIQIHRCKSKFTSCEIKFTSYEFKSSSYELKPMS